MTIDSLLDACEFVLRDLGEPQSAFWLASHVMEMKLWRASEADVEKALAVDLAKQGEKSIFVRSGDEFGLREWTP
jgi:hypothetical protein